ncbi:DUF2914 domain-containing protein [bacterium]|nr:DUF2914 domain-containing protein [bacterium]
MKKGMWVMAVVLTALLAINAQAVETKAVGAETKAAGAEAKAAGAEAKAAGAETKVTGAMEASVQSGIQVVEGVIATGIEARQPVGENTSFSKDVVKVYCWTKISGVTDPVQVIHRWKKGEQVMAEVSLGVGGSPWRIYSSKNIMPEWTGTWSVDVVVGEKVIKTLEFMIAE